MDGRRTMMMSWEGLDDLDDDEDLFFDAQRLSSAGPLDLGSSSSDEEFEDSRMSFSTASESSVFSEFQTGGFDMWMSTPESITDRRRRLMHDMGLGSHDDTPSTQILSRITDIPPPAHADVSKQEEEEKKLSPGPAVVTETGTTTAGPGDKHKHPSEPVYSGLDGILLRSYSDGHINTSWIDMKRRKEEIIGSVSKQSLTRTSSGFSTPYVGLSGLSSSGQQRRLFVAKDQADEDDDDPNHVGKDESILLIKNFDNGKEFMVKESNNDGNWNKLSDVQTGKDVTTEEFEKNAGHSPKVKELSDSERKLKRGNSSFHKSFKKSKKKGAALFKNMKLGSIGGSKTDKEKGPTITNSPSVNSSNSSSSNNNNQASTGEQKPSSQWVKARVHAKPIKEFTALHRSQEIKGHEGSIWTMKFTLDGQYLATAGEDKVIHIWEVQEFDVRAMQCADDSSSAGGTPVHPMAMVASPDCRPPLPESVSDKKKRGKKKKGIPDYVHVPETVFGLSETPFCTLDGHLDDVLDLSWSKSRLLLSSSMDKTVRLWDIETKNCLKLFSHTDYVTCIQFNPADDDYFMSGSLDAKVRIWNIPERRVMDWLDLHEMVTAVGYSSDGKVSVVGSHKGICRIYNTADFKLELKDQLEFKTKKKPQPKKITGFHFSNSNPSEVLVTSADSRVRILDGTKLVQKFKGYKNINSQFSADFSPDGKYIISASEDSQVYIWRHEETKGKHKHLIIKSYEHFPCKEVSVTAPWPGVTKLEQPFVTIHSKKHSKKSTTTLPPPAAGDDNSQSKRSSAPLPPVPKKSNASTDANDDAADASVGPSESFSSAVGSSGRLDDVASPSPSFMSSPGWGGGSHGPKTIQATAWGFVIVTGGISGVITVFQNVGLPFKVGRL